MISFHLEKSHGLSLKNLVIGSRESGKTIFSFRIAYEEAMVGKNVLYVCNKNKIEARFPQLVSPSHSVLTCSVGLADGRDVLSCYLREEDHEWCQNALALIDMKYVNNAGMLCNPHHH